MGISREQALDCFRSDDLLGLGMEADAVRRRLHPEGVVAYAVVGGVDCAAAAASEAGWDPIWRQADAAVHADASCVALRGARFKIEQFEELLAGLRRRFPELPVRGLDAPDLLRMARNSGFGMDELLARLWDAGLSAISGGGADLAGAGCAESCSVAEWIAVHRAAHRAGMRTAAQMIFGAGETAGQRVDFLQAAGELQQATGGFLALMPRSHRPPGRELDGVTAVESLQTLAISRMMLDDVEHIQADGLSRSLKVLQTALRFGGNDAGSVEAASAGAEENLRRVIRDAGFRPVERDAAYCTVFLR